MKKNLLFFISLIVGMGYAHAQNGTIRGIVLDENNLAMPGATILLDDGANGTVSDTKGNYIFYNVTTGNHTINVSFIGYEGQKMDVSVNANKTTETNFSMTSAALVGDEVIIMGDRLKGQAKALNDQKNRGNITNIVASDQIGRFPDANVGDALKRVSGITMQNDQGEARDIVIRGMAPQLNSVTINGERIPSAEGDNRRVQLDLIPSDMIQLIEVNKALTPDMDADAIGGSVNLVTRTSPNGPRISGTLGSGFNALSGKPVWTGAIILGNRFFDNKLGAVLSASYNNHNFGSDNVEAEWKDIDGVGVVLDEYQQRQYFVQRVRRSVSLGIDYKINANNTIYLNGIYNWRDDWENRFRYVVKDLGDVFENGDFTGSNGQYNALATVERQTKGGIDNDRSKSARLEDQRMYNFSLGGEHLAGNRLKINWSGSYSKASEERPNERYIQYAYEYDDGGPDGVPVYLDFSDTRKPYAESTVTNQYQSLEFDEVSEQYGYTFEETYSGKLNLQYALGNTGIIKVGASFRKKDKERDNNYYDYTPTGGANDGDAHPELGGSWDSAEGEYTDLFLGDSHVGTRNVSKDNFLLGDRYKTGDFVDNEFLGGLDLNNPSLYDAELKYDEFYTENYSANENIFAAYAMADIQLTDKLSTIFGVRLENTHNAYTGNAFDEETETILPQIEGTNDYLNVLPSIHLKYNFTNNSILRFAWSNSLARPNYFDLVPYQAYNSDDAELSEGNPNLDPYRAMNFDLMFENYFESIGLISGGAFYKDIKDFIYEKTINNYTHPTFGDVDYTTFNNGESASVYGAELAVQRQLDFLPGFLRGFGVYLNYTYTQSKAEGIEGREDEDFGLPGTAKNLFNASLSYETEKLVVRLSMNYAGDYIDEIGGEAFEDRYYDQQTFLDFNGSYAFTKNWRFFVEVNNITNQPLRYYQGVSDRTMQAEYYNVRMNAGLKFDFFGK